MLGVLSNWRENAEGKRGKNTPFHFYSAFLLKVEILVGVKHTISFGEGKAKLISKLELISKHCEGKPLLWIYINLRFRVLRKSITSSRAALREVVFYTGLCQRHKQFYNFEINTKWSCLGSSAYLWLVKWIVAFCVLAKTSTPLASKLPHLQITHTPNPGKLFRPSHYVGVSLSWSLHGCRVSSPVCAFPVASWNTYKCPFVGLGIWCTTYQQKQHNYPLQAEPQSLPWESWQVRYLQRRTQTRQRIA